MISLKSFGNSWGSSYTKFDILDIKHSFTCGDSDLCQIIKKCQNIMSRIVDYYHYKVNAPSSSRVTKQVKTKDLSKWKKCKNIPEMFGFDGEYTAEQQNLDFFW